VLLSMPTLPKGGWLHPCEDCNAITSRIVICKYRRKNKTLSICFSKSDAGWFFGYCLCTCRHCLSSTTSNSYKQNYVIYMLLTGVYFFLIAETFFVSSRYCALVSMYNFFILTSKFIIFITFGEPFESRITIRV